MAGPQDAPATSRRVVVVAGSGRSGTSTIAGVLKLVGLHIPPPEVPGNRTNPRGFFEPRWAVDFQTRLLRRASVVLTDSRPAAFGLAERAADTPEVRKEVGGWVAEHLAQSPELLIKDPRNSWFLPMWRRAAADAGAEVAFLTMLRHPAEVVGSKDTYYKNTDAGATPRHAQTTRVASWLNVALFTEASTRDSRRSFVLYNDLLEDWRSVLARTVEQLSLASGRELSPEVAHEVDQFVDPGLRRVRTEWSDIDCPDEVRDLAQDVWEQLCVLARGGGFDQQAQHRLDRIRERYTRMYDDAEALAQSSAEDARRAGVRQGRRKALQEQRQAKPPAPDADATGPGDALRRRASAAAGAVRRKAGSLRRGAGR